MNINDNAFHLIYIVEEGYSSLTCGVGAIAYNFLKAFPSIVKNLSQIKVQLELSIITLDTDKYSVGISPNVYLEAKKTCKIFGGELYSIPLKKNTEEYYFDFCIWKEYNEIISSTIERICKLRKKRVIVMANDTIFAHSYSLNENSINIWIPHSFSFVHQQSYANQDVRDEWEKSAIARIKNKKNHYYGSTAQYSTHIAQQKYGINDDKIITFFNGFYYPALNKFKTTQHKIKKLLYDYDIPLNKDIIFSFARADEYKGLDISLQAMIRFGQSHNLHSVLAAFKFSNEKEIVSIKDKLMSIKNNYEGSISLLLEYDFDFPKYLVQYKRTKYLLNLPTADFAPLIPYESELLGHENLCVVNSNIACFTNSIQDGKNGFLSIPDVDSAYTNLCKIYSMPFKKRSMIIKLSKKRTKEIMNIESNYSMGLIKVIKCKYFMQNYIT